MSRFYKQLLTVGSVLLCPSQTDYGDFQSASRTIYILKGKKLIMQTEKEKKLGLTVVFIFTQQVKIFSFCSLPQMVPLKFGSHLLRRDFRVHFGLMCS